MVKFDGNKNENRLSRGRRSADTVVCYLESKRNYSQSQSTAVSSWSCDAISERWRMFSEYFSGGANRFQCISLRGFFIQFSRKMKILIWIFSFAQANQLLRRRGRNIPIFINRIASGCMRREEAEFPFKFVSSSRAFRSESDLKDLNSSSSSSFAIFPSRDGSAFRSPLLPCSWLCFQLEFKIHFQSDGERNEATRSMKKRFRKHFHFYFF